ncbi:MAG: L,D-transpeptidase family protein [Roseomonas sp.]|nr:L,D-transpeptidase family protein [Roseomonas sp.]
MAHGALGLAAILSVAGCAASETESPGPVAFQPEEDLDRLLDNTDPVVAGEALDGPLLHRFYARRDFQPVWNTREAQANALKAAVFRARDHGLDPDLFKANMLLRLGSFPPHRRDLLLSHAVLTYAEALALGALPSNRRKDREALSPEPVDVAAVLDEALDGGDPVAAIEALAPQSATYLALRQALERNRSTGLFQRNNANRVRVIEANLERQRWLPRELPPDRVWVNVPDQQLVLYRDDRPVFVTRVVVGEPTERKQSPEFNTVIESALFNPPWIIPQDIVEADIRPMLRKDPLYLVKNNITLLPNGDARQAPGPQAGLGAVMFEMPNRFDVYLHDTPDKEAFSRDNRRLSNGCIRVHNPLEFAALLMDEPVEFIHRKVAAGDTVRKSLPEPMPVFVLYHTAFPAGGRDIEMRPDFYGRDEALWLRLQKGAPEQIASTLHEPTAGAARSSPASQAARRSATPAPARPTITRRS